MVTTLVIGVDAATSTFLSPLFREGKLPNLHRIFNEGVSGTLDSTRPPMTPQAWTSMATGVNPGKHGIFDFREQDRSTYKISSVDYRRSLSYPTLWDHFNVNDVDVGVLNYPLANPPHKIDNFFISGVPSMTKDGIAYPESVQSYLENTGYRVSPRRDPNDDADAYFRELRTLLDQRCETAIELANRHNPDLLWPVFMAIDWGQHYLWSHNVDGNNAVELLYERLDNHIGRLVERTNPDHIIVVSDHGMTQLEGEVYLNELLDNWGYLSKVAPTEPQEVVSRVVSKLWDTVANRFTRQTKDKIKAAIPNAILEAARNKAGRTGQNRLHEEIKWSDTEAFMYGSMGRVFVHDAGRYPEGTVNRSGYTDILQSLKTDFEAATDPDGNALISDVVKIADAYDGDQLDDAPDLLLEPRDWAYMIYGRFNDEPFSEPEYRLADHHPDGVVAIAGDGIPAVDNIECKITDIAPTLLFMHDLPILSDMDGSVINEVVHPTSGRPNPPVIDKLSINNAYTNSDTRQEVEDRLNDLGYL